MPSFTSITTPLGHITMVPKGAYSSSATYNRLDLVTEQNNTNNKISGLYIAKQNNFTNIPLSNSEYWMKIMDSSDLRGPDGVGILSITGPTNPGQPNTEDTYTINLTNGNFSTFKVKNGANGADGITPTFGIPEISVSKLAYGSNPTADVTLNDGIFNFDFGIPEGAPGEEGKQGIPGPAGRSISSITRTNTSGLTDTYTIHYTVGEDSEFTVTNGQKGDPGKDFHITKTYQSISDMQADKNNIEEGDFVTAINVRDNQNITELYMKNGSNDFTYLSDLTATAIRGVGIASISGPVTDTNNNLKDIYTINFTDDSYTTFTVTNGAPGQPGQPGPQGVGIASITGPITNGLVDTYTINFTEGNPTTFTVTNGKDGEVGTITWGNITGQISANNTLSSILNSKASIEYVNSAIESSSGGSGSATPSNPIEFTKNYDKLEFGLFESAAGQWNAALKVTTTETGNNASIPGITVEQPGNNKRLTLLDSGGNTIIPNLSLGAPLSIENGGTGQSLNNAPSMLTNLGSTDPASPFSATPRLGIMGTLGVANGGTGATMAGTTLLENLGIHIVDSEPSVENAIDGHIYLVCESE